MTEPHWLSEWRAQLVQAGAFEEELDRNLVVAARGMIAIGGEYLRSVFRIPLLLSRLATGWSS